MAIIPPSKKVIQNTVSFFLPSSLTIWCRLMSALLIEVPVPVMGTRQFRAPTQSLSRARRNWPVLKLNLSPSQMVTPIITTQPNRLSCWAPFVLCPRPLRAFIKIQLMSCTSLTLTNWAAIAAALCLHHIFGVACIALGKGYSPAISVVKTYILGLGSWTTTQRAHGTLLITFKRTMQVNYQIQNYRWGFLNHKILLPLLSQMHECVIQKGK